MGQLEKYGLYVLCLVIFLILGVTIWGEPEGARPETRGSAAAMNATPELGGSPRVAALPPTEVASPGGSPAGVVNASFAGGQGNTLDSLLQPAPGFGKKPEAAKPAVTKPPVNGGGAGDPVVQPPAPSSGPEGATPAATRGYKIKKGDTFEGIAARELGSRVRRQEIERLNPNVDPAKLQIGQEILLPAGAAPVLSGGEALERSGAFRTYKVGKGDTLDRIARLELGSSSRVEDIKQLNPGLDPRRLQLGQKIKLPIR